MFEKPKRQFSAVLGITAPSNEWIDILGTCPSDRSAIFVDQKRRRSVFSKMRGGDGVGVVATATKLAHTVHS